MKLALTIISLLCISVAVHAAGTAYYRPQAAAAQSAEGKKNTADEKLDLDAKKAQATKADEEATAAEKSHAKDAAAKRQRTRDLSAQLVQQYQQAQASHLKHLGDRIDRIVPAVSGVCLSSISATGGTNSRILGTLELSPYPL